MIDFAADLDDALYDTDVFAQSAVLNRASGGSVATQCFLDAETNGNSRFDSDVLEKNYIISFPYSKVGNVYRGDTVTIGNAIYTIDSILFDDDYDVKVIARKE